MNPTDSFSALLLSRFEKAIQQSRRSVAAQERLGRCLDEIATIQTTFADNMTRAITSGIADVDIALGHTIGKDGFHDFSTALLLTMKQILQSTVMRDTVTLGKEKILRYFTLPLTRRYFWIRQGYLGPCLDAKKT